MKNNIAAAVVAGVSFIIGLAVFGVLVGNAAMKFKSLERTVVVKGLSEREYPADIVIWPIEFSEAGNDAAELYKKIEGNSSKIIAFLKEHGISSEEITVSPPAVTDKSAMSYSNNIPAEFRYSSTQTITVYSEKIGTVKKLMSSLSELGRQGIVFNGNSWQTEYIFNRLNEVKPGMIEEATWNARKAAQRFADDSDSSLGKIKTASQGQFSISPRDNNNPDIKEVRVVTTVEYYLTD